VDPNCRNVEPVESLWDYFTGKWRHRQSSPVPLAVALREERVSMSPSKNAPRTQRHSGNPPAHGAKAREICPNGDPLVNRAAWLGYSRCVELLLAHGATVNEKHENGTTVLMSALAGGDLRTVRVLVEHGVGEPGLRGTIKGLCQ
jgi:ankyrin repeat protein